MVESNVKIKRLYQFYTLLISFIVVFFTGSSFAQTHDIYRIDANTIKEYKFVSVMGQQEFPGLYGPYFGQELPGTQPKVFADGIINTT